MSRLSVLADREVPLTALTEMVCPRTLDKEVLVTALNICISRLSTPTDREVPVTALKEMGIRVLDWHEEI